MRNGVGLFEVSSFSKFMVTGPAAKTWLDRLLAGPIPPAGRAALAPMLSPKGRLIGDFTVSNLDGDSYLLVGSGMAQRIHERWFHLNTQEGEEVRVENLSSAWAGLHLAGPNARGLLSRVAGHNVAALPFLANCRADLEACPEADDHPRLLHGRAGLRDSFPDPVPVRIPGAPARGGRLPWPEACGLARHDVAAAGKGVPELGAGTVLRLLAVRGGSRPLRAMEQGRLHRPRGRAPRWRGVQERLATLVVDADGADCWGGESVFRDGRHVGYVTSGGYGPWVGESLALAYLKTDACEDGAAVEVLVRGERRPAAISRAPRFDPAGGRLRI